MSPSDNDSVVTTERRPLGTIDEVAAYLQVSKATLRDQRHRNVGVGALATKVGKHLRWRWEDIERYIDEQASVPVGGSAA